MALWIPYPYHSLQSVLGGKDDLAIWSAAVWAPLLLGVIALTIAWVAVEFFDLSGRPEGETGRSRRARRKVWADPLAWKGFYFLVGGRVGFGVRLALVIVLGVVAAWAEGGFGRTVGFKETLHALVIVPLALIPLESLLQVARAFHAEVQDQTLSSLAVLPPHRHPWLAGLVYGGMTAALPYGIVWVVAAALHTLLLGDPVTPLSYGSAAACVYSFAFLLGHLVAWLSIRHGLGAVAIAIAAAAGLVFGVFGFQGNDALGLFTILGLLGWPVYLVYVDRIRTAFVNLVRDTATRG